MRQGTILAVAAFTLSKFALGADPASLPAGKELAQAAPLKAGLTYTYDSFDKELADWHQVSASLSRAMPFGLIIGRLNWARRFAVEGVQGEVDAYPKIDDGVYAYLNVGYSGSPIFPEWRFGGEGFFSLPYAFEVSAGFRHLIFDVSKVTLMTASVSKYTGSFLLSLRGNFIPDAMGDSVSGLFAARRYHSDTDWIGILAGIGTASQERLSSLEFYRLRSWKAGVESYFTIGDAWAVRPGIGLEVAEARPGESRQDRTVSLGVERAF